MAERGPAGPRSAERGPAHPSRMFGPRSAARSPDTRPGWTDTGSELVKSILLEEDWEKAFPALQKLPGYPSLQRLQEGSVVCIECDQEIPCDPCEAGCPSGAITIGPEITYLPSLRDDICHGCGLCIAKCPGQAIFVINYNYSHSRAAISFPFEFYPLPEVGEQAAGVDRNGRPVTEVEIVAVDARQSFDQTAVVTVAVDKEFIHQVRSIRRRGSRGASPGDRQ